MCRGRLLCLRNIQGNCRDHVKQEGVLEDRCGEKREVGLRLTSKSGDGEKEEMDEQ